MNPIFHQVLSLDEIDPRVNYMNIIQCEPNGVYGPRMIYDYHFMYVMRGKGEIEINGTAYHAGEGDLFFNEPGVVHNILPDPSDPFLLNGLHFTFLPHEKLPYPIGPLEVSLFRREQIVERVSFKDFSWIPNHIDCREDVQVGEKLLAVTREYEEQKRYCKTRIDGLLKAWLAYVAQLVEVGGKAQPEARTKQSLRGVIDFIHAHYNEPLTYEMLGQQFSFHPNYINRMLRAWSGYSLHQYVLNLRMKKALDMLVYTSVPLGNIAALVGYEDVSYFTRIFKKKMGCTPGQVRKNTIPW